MGLMSKLRRLLLAALFLAAPLAAWGEDAGKPDTTLARISSLFQTPNPFGAEIFADYYGVFQGNPVGGLSQDFAYSQYLIFGMKSKEPLGWRGGGFKISAVSAAGRDLSEEIGNAFTVSQAWAGNSLFFTNASSHKKLSTTGWSWASGGWPPVNFSAPCRLSICL